MDKDKFKSNGFRDSFMNTKGLLFHPWHSTPVKKYTDEDSMARRLVNVIHSNSSEQKSSLSTMQGSQTPTTDLELTIIQKQRTELQLLVAELKNREKELNNMAASHHKQLQAWEQDRQKVLSLEHRCTRLEDELHRRNKAIRAVARRLKTSEVREQDCRKELSIVQQQMQELSYRQQYSIQQHQDLEEKNRSLNSNLMSLSSQLGQLQAHEEELNSLIKIKDAVLTETTNRIARLSTQLQESETTLKEYQSHESERLQEMEEYRGFLQEARQENAQLRDVLEEKHLEINSQREELINLRQENQLLRKELTLADEGDNWRDELLSLARSKQERTESELLCLRQVCEHQQNDLQLLKLHLDTTREALMQNESQRSLASEDTVARASCSLEQISDQETEMDESIEACSNTTLNVIDLEKNPTITATSSEQSSDLKKRGQSYKTLVFGSDGRSVALPPKVSCCGKCSNNLAENKEEDCCSSETEMDIIVVIDHIAELEEQLVLVDVNSKNPSQSSRPGDVTCVYLDCSGPSPQMRTVNPGLAEDLVLSIQQQEDFSLSTSCLQRMLATSQQVCASLEPVMNSEKGCDSVCSQNDASIIA